MVKAKDIVVITLTDKWIAMAPLMQVLCVAKMGYVVSNLHFNLFKAIGRTQILFICELINKILGILVLLITFQYGLMLMVWGLLVYAALSILVSSWFLWHFIGITPQDQGRQVYMVLVNALIPIFACFLIGTFFGNIYLRLGLSVLAYFSIYGILAWLEKDKTIDFLMGYFPKVL